MNENLKNIFNSLELEENSVVKKYLTTAVIWHLLTLKIFVKHW